MKKALVMGANGFLGSMLVDKLINCGIEVIAVDLQGCSNKISSKARFVSIDAHDCGNLKEKITDIDIDVMFYMAWAGSFGDARGDYTLQLDNVKCTCDAVREAAEMGIKRFVGAGTLAQKDCMAYIGEDGSSPNMISCYGIAKTTAQYMSKAIANSLKIEHIWCIISNTYGVGNTTMNFINFAARKMLNGERASFTTAEQNYDFVYVTDTIKGLCLCAEKGKNNNTYYIGSGSARPLKEYIELIKNAIDPSITLFLGDIPFNGISLPIDEYSCESIQRDTGYMAEVDFADGIQKTVRWLKENR